MKTPLPQTKEVRQSEIKEDPENLLTIRNMSDMLVTAPAKDLHTSGSRGGFRGFEAPPHEK